MKFKVGDIVKQAAPWVYTEHSNEVYVVYEIREESRWPISVKSTNDPLVWIFSEDELEFAEGQQLEFKF